MCVYPFNLGNFVYWREQTAKLEIGKSDARIKANRYSYVNSCGKTPKKRLNLLKYIRKIIDELNMKGHPRGSIIELSYS
jgi:hypothetical protein